MTDLQPTTWRIIYSPPARGAWNMALDEALLESTGSGAALPTLRFYRWNPPCLSLGYAQPIADVDPKALLRLGWDLVRRPTGGKAILHTDELTYSVTGPAGEPRLNGSVLESYRVLATALLNGLLDLQIPAEALPQPVPVPGSDPKGPVCFEVPSNYEITVGGKKLVGSAQSRRKIGVLQHGSLPLYGDLARITQVLDFPDPQSRTSAASRLMQRATTVESALGRRISWEEAAASIQKAFEETLQLSFTVAAPNPDELARAQTLMEEKYAHSGWNARL